MAENLDLEQLTRKNVLSGKKPVTITPKQPTLTNDPVQPEALPEEAPVLLNDEEKKLAEVTDPDQLQKVLDAKRKQGFDLTTNAKTSMKDLLDDTSDEVVPDKIPDETIPSDEVVIPPSEEETSDIVPEATPDKTSQEKYKKSMMSIWDAYNQGLIDKDTANYFTIDAIASLAKNLGRGIGNVGAQFTGGTIDNNEDESLWSARRNAMLANEITSETNKQEDTDKNLEYLTAKEKLTGLGLSNEQADRSLEASRYFEDLSNDTSLPESVRHAYKLLSSAATHEIGTEEWAGLGVSEALQTETGMDLLNAVTTALESGGEAAEAVLELASVILGKKSNKTDYVDPETGKVSAKKVTQRILDGMINPVQNVKNMSSFFNKLRGK